MPVSPVATTLIAEQGAHLLVVGQQAVGVGDQDPLAAVAVAGRHLHDRRRRLARAASSTPLQQLDLGGLGDVVGAALDVLTGARGCGRERHGAAAAAALAGGGGRGLGGGEQSGLAEVGGVGEAGRLALDDPDAGAPVAAAT